MQPQEDQAAVAKTVPLVNNHDHKGLLAPPGNHRTFLGCAFPTPTVYPQRRDARAGVSARVNSSWMYTRMHRSKNGVCHKGGVLFSFFQLRDRRSYSFKEKPIGHTLQT